MDETSDILIQLASKLLQATKSELVAWEPTDDPEAFRYSTDEAAVVIDRFRRPVGWRTVLRVFNSDDVEIDTFALFDSSELEYEGQDVAHTFIELHGQARRQALHVDEVIGQLLAGLG